MNRVLVFWLALLLVFSGATALLLSWRYFHDDRLVITRLGDEYLQIPSDNEQKWLQDFTLIRRTNEPFHSEQLQGRVWIASFFFASCPTICRTQNEHVKLLHSDFVDEKVTFVGITCDPQNDSPAVLQDYAKQFTNDQESWFFLTGNFDYIRRVAAEKFKFPLGPKTHSERFAIVDKWGNVRGAYHWNNPEEWLEMRRQIKHLVLETEEPAQFIEQKRELPQLQDDTIGEDAGNPKQTTDPPPPTPVPNAP